jgi:hypothetical protein
LPVAILIFRSPPVFWMRSPLSGDSISVFLQLFELFIRGDLLYLTGKHRGLDKLNRVTHGCLLYIFEYMYTKITLRKAAFWAIRRYLAASCGLLASPAVTAVRAALQRIKRLTFAAQALDLRAQAFT